MKNIILQFGNWFCKQNTQKKLLYIGFCLLFFLIFLLNYFFPIYCDDMMYSVVKYGESISLAKNLQETGSFLWMYYFEWGGRVMAHLVAHILLLFNFLGQDIINSLVYCLLIYLSYKICIGKNKQNIFVFVFLALLVFYFTPSFLSSAVWITGSANYLWMITLTLAFLYPYIAYSNNKIYKDSKLKIFALLIFGIAASWTNENLAPVLFLILIAYLLQFYVKDKKLPRWSIAGAVGVVIGCSLMILAPGNAVRAEIEGFPSLFSSLNVMTDRLPSIQSSYQHFMLRPILIYLVALVFFYYFPRQDTNHKRIFIQSLIFFIAANISIWLTILAPTFPPRAFMSITVLTIISIGILYANINFKKMLPCIINLVFLAGICFYASIDYITFLKGSYFLHKQMQVREQIIDEAKAEGKTHIQLEIIRLDYRFEYTDFANYYKDYYNINVDFVEKVKDNEE